MKNKICCKISIRVSISIAFILLSTSSLQASFPPQDSVNTAIKLGKAAFIGRVVKLREVKIDHDYIVDEAEVVIMKRYFGVNNLDSIRVNYTSQINGTTEYPIDLRISNLYLFVFKNEVRTGKISFDSDLVGGVDNAYLVDFNSGQMGFDKPFYLSGSDDRIGFESAYGGKPEYLNLRQLEKYLRSRKSDLDKHKK